MSGTGPAGVASGEARAAAGWMFARAAFPATLGGAVWATLALLERGVEPALAFAAPVAATYLGVAALERVFPAHAAWNRGRGDVRVDLGHLLVSGVLALRAVEPLLLVGAVAAGGALSRALGSSLWPADWPLLAQLALALLAGEFFMYWIHRLTHEVDWLWRFHATHHSAPRLYCLNAGRFHPVDLVLSHASWFLPLVALGAPESLLALYVLVTAVHGVFQHANLELRLGPLNWVFSMAELHRWHHSRELSEANRNYGQNLIVWDVVFGTRYLPPERDASEEVGLSDLPAFPMTYWAQLASPFRFARIREAGGPGAGAPPQSSRLRST